LILAISNENEKLISESCKENGFEDVQIYTGIKNLNNFIIRDLRNLNNFKYIIIDITSTNESEEEIIKTVVTIKSMYNIRVIIMANGYKVGNTLLSRLFLEGIYNFIVGDTYQLQKEEIKSCISGERKSIQRCSKV